MRILTADGTCRYDQVDGIAVFGHDATVGIDIVVVLVLGHDPDDRDALADSDTHMSTLSLMTLCFLDERTLQKRLFDLAHIDIVYIPR